MEDMVVRPRYPRRNNLRIKRRKKKQENEANNMVFLLLRQALISILILLILWGVKSINSPFTNYISGKIKWVVIEHTDIKTVYEGIDNLVEKAKAIYVGSGNPNIENVNREASANKSHILKETVK